MPPPVVWTHRAERRLQCELIRSQATHARLVGTVADLNSRLAAAFPRCDAVIVLEVYLGFRPRTDEYILLVDVRDIEQPGTCIVKLGPDERLRQELDAWLSCRQLGFRGSAVFMALEPHYRPDYPHRFAALVYQDAQPHLGTEQPVWLETAVLQAVRFGVPSLRSVLSSIHELYAQLGRYLYGAARVEALETTGIELNPGSDGARKRLRDVLALWAKNPSAVAVRQQVTKGLPNVPDRYKDPIDYFAYLEELLVPPDKNGKPTPPEQVLPTRLRGPAHGDLHGRNVLVGVDENRTSTPALFDYENMSCNNLLGWDFAKLETELKIRALDAELPAGGQLSAFALAAEEFETELNRRTNEYRGGGWPAGGPADEPLERLFTVLLFIRQQAETHLGSNRKRSNDWLHEFYFLLGCYGVTCGRFENLNDRERAAALVSAGAAVVQYDRGRRRPVLIEEGEK